MALNCRHWVALGLRSWQSILILKDQHISLTSKSTFWFLSKSSWLGRGIIWHWEGNTHRYTPLLWAKIGIWKAIVEKVPLENIVFLWIRFPPYISILFLQHFCSAPNWKVRCPVLILRAGSGFEKAFRLSPSQPAHLHMVCSERSVSVQQLVFASCHVSCSCCLAD